MPKRRDLTGLKFYMLEAVAFCGHDKYSTPLWLCRCDCGGSIEVRSSDLLWGDKRSCGCIPHWTKELNVSPGSAQERPNKKENDKKWRAKNGEKLREYERRALKRNPERGRRRSRNYYQSHPERNHARTAVARAIAQGLLPKQSECKCANPACNHRAEEYHHWSYEETNWLSVIPTCKECHVEIHQGGWIIDDPQKYVVKVLGVSLVG